MEEGIRQTADGHYEMPLPFRGNTPKLPNNKTLALRRLVKLKTRIENDKLSSRLHGIHARHHRQRRNVAS